MGKLLVQNIMDSLPLSFYDIVSGRLGSAPDLHFNTVGVTTR